MKAVVKAEPKVEDFFQNTKSRRSFIAGEKAIAYDVGQLLVFERNFTLRHEPDGLPQVSVLVACWKRARGSFQRVAEALPAGELKEAMFLELQIREEAMDRLCDQAQAQLNEAKLKEANGHA
jgi:hypothetical protein